MIIQNSIFHVNLQSFYYPCSYFSALNTNFHWPYWDMHSSSGLVSRNGFRQISATGGALVPTFLPAIIMFFIIIIIILLSSFIIMYHVLMCIVWVASACSRVKGLNVQPWTKLWDTSSKLWSVLFYRSPKYTATLSPPSGYAPVCFRVLLLFFGNSTAP